MKVQEQRMVTVALRHLSGVQKGIQSLHAVVDFAQKFGQTPEYQRWANKDKTIFVLEAHTNGQLEDAFKKLRRLGVPVEKFKEPDTGNIVTAIAFLIEETVFDTKKYENGKSIKDLEIRKIKNRFSLATN